jgi:uncharacterized membrane protein YdjX (TVP38/TMEM64 family)
VIDLVKNIFKDTLRSKRRLAVIAVSIAIYIITYLIFRFNDLDQDSISEFFINYFGKHNFLTIFFIQLFLSLTPLPDSIITYLSVVLIGVYQTFWAVYLGMLISSIIHFWIARSFGPGLVAKFFPKLIHKVNDFNGEMDTHHLIIYRFLSFVSFDIVAYMAGFSKISFRNFFISTALGLIPMIVPNILLAYGLLEENLLNTALLWAGAGIIMLLFAYLVKKFN